MGIYLDNNSSSPIDERVLAVMVDVYLIHTVMQTAEPIIMVSRQE